MTVTTETFTGTDGDPPASPRVVDILGSGSGAYMRIQTNTLEANQDSNAYYSSVCNWDGNDYDYVDTKVKIRFVSTDAERYPAIGFRMSGGTMGWAEPWGEVNNGYCAYLDNLANMVVLQKLTGGSQVSAWSATGKIINGDESWWLRVLANGSALKVKTWEDGTSEPGTWDIEQTDATYTTGRLGLRAQAQTINVKTRFDDWTFDDGVSGGTPQELATNTAITVGSSANLSLIGPGSYIQEIGFNTGATNTTSLAVSFSGATKPAVGDTVVVWGARDNLTNDPATADSVTDGAGNTYTRVARAQPAGTSTASAGLVVVAFVSRLTNAWTPGTNTITWSWGTNRTAKCMIVEHWQGPLTLIDSNTNGAAGASAISVATTVSAQVSDIIAAMVGVEHSTASTTGGDSDTTGGNWSTFRQIASTGTTTAAMKLGVQRKGFLSASGTQTFNATNTSATDMAAIILLLRETVATPQELATNTALTVGGNGATLGLGRLLGTSTAVAVGTSASSLQTAKLLATSTALSVGSQASIQIAKLLATSVGLVTGSQATLGLAKLLASSVDLVTDSQARLAILRELSSSVDLVTGSTANLAIARELASTVNLLIDSSAAMQQGQLLASTTGLSVGSSAILGLAKELASSVGVTLDSAADLQIAKLLATETGVTLGGTATLVTGKLLASTSGILINSSSYMEGAEPETPDYEGKAITDFWLQKEWLH